ncbi:MAG: S8 family serine peptidase [Chthonomonas sp.]|nr:S8 family serine peptidase [Chthonomonas sp.]
MNPYLVREVPAIRMSVVRPPAGMSWKHLQKSLLGTGLFESVLPDTVAMPTALTNDPLANQQWHLFQTSWPRAMDQTLTGVGPIVAVVDTGVSNHVDLAPNLVSGYNAVTGLPQSSGGNVNDVYTGGGHGTRVAGIIGARGNNGLGVTGVSPFCRIMPVCVSTQTNGSSTRSTIFAGLTWAAQNGAKVGNVSYSEVSYPDVESVSASLRSTQQMNVVWSARKTTEPYPDFDHRNVTVVGGTDASDSRWTDNGGFLYGVGTDIYAPCTSIFSTRQGSPPYGYAPDGVSFAVPQVSGAIALIRQLDPSLTAEQAEYRVLRYGRDLGSVGNDLDWGNGRLNIGASAFLEGRRYVLSEINTFGALQGTAAFPILYRIGEFGNVAGVIVLQNSRAVLAVWSPPYTSAPQIIDQTEQHVLNDLGIEDAEDTSADPNTLSFVGSSKGNVTREMFVRKPGQLTVTKGNWSGTYSSKAFGLSGATVVGEHVFEAGVEVPGDTNGFSVTSGNIDNPTYPLTAPPHSFTGDHVIYKKKSAGYIGTSSPNQSELWVFAQQGSNINSLFFIGYPNIRGYITDANNSSDFVLNARVDGEPNNTGAYLFNGVPNLVEGFGFNRFLWGINDSSDIVGNSFLPPLNSMTNAPPFSTSTAYVIRGLGGSGPFSNFVQGSYPGVTFREIRDINNSGSVIVNADSSSGRKAFVGQPTGNTFMGVNLGQLGANPTYIGSIPPSLHMTFANAQGQVIAGGPYIIPYGQHSDGRVVLPNDANLGASYRVFLQCEQGLIPGYPGPKFLAKLYPPLSEPPLPADATYFPYSGTSSQSGPMITMYAGDVDDSGEVDASDIDLVIAAFGTVYGQPGWSTLRDVDGSGEIDASDIDVVISNFGLTDDSMTP